MLKHVEVAERGGHGRVATLRDGAPDIFAEAALRIERQSRVEAVERVQQPREVDDTKGSPVRVRQRARENPAQAGLFFARRRKRWGRDAYDGPVARRRRRSVGDEHGHVAMLGERAGQSRVGGEQRHGLAGHGLCKRDVAGVVGREALA